MSLPDRGNPYNFDPYLEWRGQVDYYADDPFLHQVLAELVFALFLTSQRLSQLALGQQTGIDQNLPESGFFSHRLSAVVRLSPDGYASFFWYGFNRHP